jgi:hypothetical protein
MEITERHSTSGAPLPTQGGSGQGFPSPGMSETMQGQAELF